MPHRSQSPCLVLVLLFAASGDSSAMTGHVLYPIEVRVNGQLTVVPSAAEFDRQYAGIFTSRLQEALLEAEEGDLALQLDGIMAAGGVLWFNQFCADAACTQDEFLITQINH